MEKISASLSLSLSLSMNTDIASLRTYIRPSIHILDVHIRGNSMLLLNTHVSKSTLE